MKNMRFLTAFILILFPVTAFSQEKNAFSLNQLITLGLRNNPMIKAEKQRMDASQAAYQSSKRYQNPKLDYNQGTANSYDGTITRTTRGFLVSQPIENPFKRQFRIESMENHWKAVESSYENALNEFKYNIKIQYYQILLLMQKEQIAKNNLRTIEEIYWLIKNRAELGEVKELDAIKLYVETLKAQKYLNQIQTEKQLSKENLNRLLGNVLPQDYSLSEILDHFYILIDEESLIRRALSSQPLLNEKTMEIKEAESILRFKKWQRLPDLNLSGFSRRELDGRNIGFGVSFEIPLWNWKSSEIEEATRTAQQKELELEALQLKVITEVKSKIKQLQLSIQTLELFASGLLTQAEESLKIAEISYKEGEISLIDYLDSQRTYNSIIQDFQEALFLWNADKAALEKAVGEEIK